MKARYSKYNKFIEIENIRFSINGTISLRSIISVKQLIKENKLKWKFYTNDIESY